MDDLKQAWAELDRRLGTVAGEVKVARAQTASRGLSRTPLFELAMNLLVLLLLGACYPGHLDEPLFLASVAVLHVVSIVLTVSCIRELAMIAELDWAAPVTQAARSLERLRAHRLFVTKWLLIVIPLLWPPLAVVLVVLIFKTEPNMGWLVGNVVFGIVAAVLLVAVARRLRRATSPWVRRLMDDIAGRNLTAAIGFLGEVERFGREEG